MSQSRAMSAVEAVASTAIGFGVALATQIVVFPIFDWRPSLNDNLAIAAIFTGVSIARGYLVRRLFNWIGGANILRRTEISD